MRTKPLIRAVVIAATAALLAFALVGCGDDQPSGSETGKGAPNGAKGDQSGGFAVEAGKQRSEADIQNEKNAYGTEPPPVQIDLASSSGWNVSSPQLKIITTNAQLKEYKKKLKSKYADTEGIVPIDFKTRQLILVQMPKLPGGSAVQVTNVRTAPNKIIVEAVKVTPGKGCKVKGTNNPFNIVETRKLSGTPTLKLDAMKNDPCK